MSGINVICPVEQCKYQFDKHCTRGEIEMDNGGNCITKVIE